MKFFFITYEGEAGRRTVQQEAKNRAEIKRRFKGLTLISIKEDKTRTSIFRAQRG